MIPVCAADRSRSAFYLWRQALSAQVFAFFCLLVVSTSYSEITFKPKSKPIVKSQNIYKQIFIDQAKSPEELLQRAIVLLNQGDTAGLYRLSVMREEYIALYPFLPNSDTVNTDDMNFRMGFFLMDNRKMLLRELTKFPGPGTSLSKFAFTGVKEECGRMFFMHGLHVWVKREGREIELHFAKSMVSMDGGWKFWGFSGD